MNLRGVKIKQLQFEEIEEVIELPPHDWNFNIEEFLNLHIGMPYFYPIVARDFNETVGFGNLIVNGNAGWVGNVIVRDDYRNNGIGEMITRRLIDYCFNRNIDSILLIAVFQAESLYKRLGFRKSQDYCVLIGKQLEYKENKAIRRMKKADMDKIKDLDWQINGENRSYLLEHYYTNAFVYEKKKKILGYFLPEFENGPIYAIDEEVGKDLLVYKHSLQEVDAILPAKNKNAIDFLLEQGFEKKSNLARMFMGREVLWEPEHVFSRAAGYCG